jgi:hypothetical protein
LIHLKKKMFSLLALAATFVMLGSFVAYAASASVYLPTNVKSRQSALISVRDGNLHLEVTSLNRRNVGFAVYRYVSRGPDQFITGGQTTSRSAYARAVSSGRYYIVLTCKDGNGYGCNARGSINQ